MNIHDLFTAKTEQEFGDMVKRNDGHIESRQETKFETWIEYEVDSNNKVSKPGKAQPSELIYMVKLPTQSLRVTCATNGITIFVRELVEL